MTDIINQKTSNINKGENKEGKYSDQVEIQPRK